MKKIIKWFYKKFVDEIYIPEKIEFLVKKKGCIPNEPQNSVQIIANRGKGYHEKYFWNGINAEITIWDKEGLK